MIQSYGFACTAANEPMKPWSFERRDLRDDDVRIEITHCGVCHSDIHQARTTGALPPIRWFPDTRSSDG